jgi:hypothetical protein
MSVCPARLITLAIKDHKKRDLSEQDRWLVPLGRSITKRVGLHPEEAAAAACLRQPADASAAVSTTTLARLAATPPPYTEMPLLTKRTCLRVRKRGLAKPMSRPVTTFDLFPLDE